MDSSISEFGHIHCTKQWFESKLNNKKPNSLAPNDTALYELSHLDLYCAGISFGLLG